MYKWKDGYKFTLLNRDNLNEYKVASVKEIDKLLEKYFV